MGLQGVDHRAGAGLHHQSGGKCGKQGEGALEFQISKLIFCKINIIPADFGDRDDGPLARSCRFDPVLILITLSRMGLIMINLTNPVVEVSF